MINISFLNMFGFAYFSFFPQASLTYYHINIINITYYHHDPKTKNIFLLNS